MKRLSIVGILLVAFATSAKAAVLSTGARRGETASARENDTTAPTGTVTTLARSA